MPMPAAGGHPAGASRRAGRRRRPALPRPLLGLALHTGRGRGAAAAACQGERPHAGHTPRERRPRCRSAPWRPGALPPALAPPGRRDALTGWSGRATGPPSLARSARHVPGALALTAPRRQGEAGEHGAPGRAAGRGGRRGGEGRAQRSHTHPTTSAVLRPDDCSSRAGLAGRHTARGPALGGGSTRLSSGPSA